MSGRTGGALPPDARGRKKTDQPAALAQHSQIISQESPGPGIKPLVSNPPPHSIAQRILVVSQLDGMLEKCDDQVFRAALEGAVDKRQSKFENLRRRPPLDDSEQFAAQALDVQGAH